MYCLRVCLILLSLADRIDLPELSPVEMLLFVALSLAQLQGQTLMDSSLNHHIVLQRIAQVL